MKSGDPAARVSHETIHAAIYAQPRGGLKAAMIAALRQATPARGRRRTTLEVDAIRVIFQNAPNTEAPRTMNVFFPELKTLFIADMIFATLHNLYTLMGAQVRDGLAWSKSLNETLQRFGPETEVMCGGHNWPRFGRERVADVIRVHRDIYANLDNQSLHHANQGVTINQIHNVYKPPKSLEDSWFIRGYHGHITHNARAVVQRFLGFWDAANPATLVPLSPEDSAPLYVEMMGGAERTVARGRELYDTGDYLLAMEIANKLVQAEPANQTGQELLADIFEQPGYQSECGGHRNSYLAAAYELRSGIPGARSSTFRAPMWSAGCRPSCSSTSSASRWTAAGPRASASP